MGGLLEMSLAYISVLIYTVDPCLSVSSTVAFGLLLRPVGDLNQNG